MMQRPDLSDSRHSQTSRQAARSRVKGKTDSRGVALVITLLLLFLMSALGLAAVLTSSSDLMINGYYGNYRGSFYAADSGLNIARQSMQASIMGLVPNGTTWQTTWTTCANGPIAVNQSSSTNLSWTNNYSSRTALTGSSATPPWLRP